MAKLKSLAFFKPKINIDGVEITIHIRRLSAEQWEAFHKKFVQYGFEDQKRGSVVEPHVITVDEETEQREWIREVLQAYVSVPVGEIDDEDDHPVVDGHGLFRVYGSRMDVIPQVITLLWIENRLPEHRKNALRSRVASFVGSVTEHPQTDIGNEQEPVAPVAENKISASPEAATELEPSESSGMTVLSN